MYVHVATRLGFWGGMVRKSWSLFKHTVPVAAGAATGGTAGAAFAAIGQGAELARSKQTQAADAQPAQTETRGTNFLSRTSNSTLAIGGLTAAALVAVLARR